jgi:hypothetical protein
MRNAASLLVRAAITTGALLVFSAAACTDNVQAPLDARTNPRGSGATASQTIAATGGTVSVGAATLDVPAGAVPAGTLISITESTTPAPAELNAVTPVYTFSPDGLVFTQPISVKFAVAGASPSSSVYWSQSGDATKFAPVNSVVGGGFVTANVTHFSSGCVALSQSGGASSGTSSCTPTSCAGIAPGQACTSCSPACDLGGSVCTCSNGHWACGQGSSSSSSGATVDAGGTGGGTVLAPTITPAQGPYGAPVSVSISTATAGATIFFTTNGTNPTTSSYVFTSPIYVSVSTTFRAFASKAGMTNSAVASATYTLSGPGYGIGGTVSGLAAGATLVLKLTTPVGGTSEMPITANGPFTFLSTFPTNTTYDVSVATQPTSQTCSVSSGSGLIVSQGATIGVTCL